MQLSKIFASYLNGRNKKIIQLRKKGKIIKEIASKFNLSQRHIRRIIKNADRVS